ncbi:MAG: HAMP domain-containing histidine kinase [Deltaproteobacteria bacterium]|nr:MAG: HAMP domain-containing histidine kinase [Deltaproteobacteria bacterium]
MENRSDSSPHTSKPTSSSVFPGSLPSFAPALPTIGIVARDRSRWKALAEQAQRHQYPVLFLLPQELFVALDEQHPDLLLLDAEGMEPPILETCRMIRSNERWHSIELVVAGGENESDELYGAGCSLVTSVDVRPNGTLWRIVERCLKLQAREDELHNAQETIEQQAKSMRNQRKNYALFSGTMSHEIRTPIGVIEGFVINLLDGLEGELSELQRMSLEIVQKNIHRLKQYLGEVLDHSKLEVQPAEEKSRPETVKEAPRRVYRRRLLPLREVMEDVVEMFRDHYKRKPLELRVELDDHIPRLWMDRAKIRQVLVNLLSNAHKFTPAGGAVTVRLERIQEQSESSGATEGSEQRREAFVRMVVTDTGVGIPKEEQATLFSQFVRAEGAELEADGSGLGLAICKQIVEEHGGEMTLESEVDQGTSVAVRLPVDLRRRRLGKLFVFSQEQQLWKWIADYKDNLEEIERVSTLEEVSDMVSRGCLDVLLVDHPELFSLFNDNHPKDKP